MNPRLRTLVRQLRRLDEDPANDPPLVTPECHCPPWRDLADALAAASVAADQVPNGRPVARVLALLAVVADLVDRTRDDNDPTP